MTKLLTGINICRILHSTDINKCLKMKGGYQMKENNIPMFVGVDQVQFDIGCSRAKAYEVIKKLNKQLLNEYPKAIVVAGKVNRIWYEEACLKNGEH